MDRREFFGRTISAIVLAPFVKYFNFDLPVKEVLLKANTVSSGMFIADGSGITAKTFVSVTADGFLKPCDDGDIPIGWVKEKLSDGKAIVIINGEIEL